MAGDERRDDLEQVVADSLEGNRGAQRTLYDRCHQKVYRLVVRMVGVQDAPDVSQQVFLQVFRKLDQFSGRSGFETWLYRLAVNECLQHLRRRGRRTDHELTREPAGDSRSHVTRMENRELIEQALERLEPELRSIFLLKEVEDLSYREIADAVDIPAGTVGSRLNRARRELKGHLTELGWES
jgi:RNA polymerase sigma-70 factor (ECF subfamily)